MADVAPPSPGGDDPAQSVDACCPADESTWIERLRRAAVAAGTVPRDCIPAGLAPLIDLLPTLLRASSELEAARSRTLRAEQHLDDMIDHLRVVEVAMSSLAQARDDAMRALSEARTAAGIPLGPTPPSDLSRRIAVLRAERDAQTERADRLRAALALCHAHLRGQLDGGATAEVIRAARDALGLDPERA